MFTTSHKAGVAVLAFALLGGLQASADLSSAESRGRAAYFGEKGSALDGATARIGELTTKLPANSFPCASCHGRTGLGKAERGVQPSQITRDALTRPYTVKEATGRKRPPYTLASFRNAVRTGKDAGGNDLSEAMPRFNLTDKQIADLWAFLAVVDEVSDPGITETSITVGVITDPRHPATRTQLKVLDALAADINAIGGLHGRKLIFEGMAPASAVSAASTHFALLAPQGAPPGGLDPSIPVVSVIPAEVSSSASFALTAGEADQTAALRRFAVEQFEVVSLRDACAAKKGDTVLLASAACLVNAKPARRVLMTQSVFASLAPASRTALPPETYIAIATPLGRIDSNAQAAFARTRAKAGGDKSAILAEADAYSAAAVMVESLMRTGRDVSRAGFVERLESVRDFKGAMTPALTFGPNRHVGSRGAEIVRYDPAKATLATSGVWVEPGPR
ncbi:c-type cytochrome [Hyphomonas sp.]|uniref:c-type cytochrome n=1 Tax=Hyphomonas sp. TaxID=87 RepID=UPI00391BAAEF